MLTMNNKKAIFGAILLLTLIFSTVSIASAEVGKLKTMNISLKPEFDHEKAVFMNATGEVETGTEMRFFTPNTLIEDDTIHFCAITNGSHQCQTREKTVEGDLFNFLVPMPAKEYSFEAYFQGIKDDGGQKTLDYTFKAGQDIGELNIYIAEPKNSKSFTISPNPTQTGEDDNKLKNAVYSYKNVKKGKEYKFKIQYVKKGWEVFFAHEGMGGSASPISGGSGSGAGAGAIVVAVVAALAVAGGIVFGLMYAGNKSPGSSRKQKRPVPVAPKGKARFCTNCGTRVTSGKFCSNCGASVK